MTNVKLLREVPFWNVLFPYKKCTNHLCKCFDPPTKTKCAKKVLQTIRASLYTHIPPRLHPPIYGHIWKQHILKKGFPSQSFQQILTQWSQSFEDHHRYYGVKGHQIFRHTNWFTDKNENLYIDGLPAREGHYTGKLYVANRTFNYSLVQVQV